MGVCMPAKQTGRQTQTDRQTDKQADSAPHLNFLHGALRTAQRVQVVQHYGHQARESATRLLAALPVDELAQAHLHHLHVGGIGHL